MPQLALALRLGAAELDQFVAQVAVDGQGFEHIAGPALEADVHLVGAGPDRDIRGFQRRIAQASPAAYRYRPLGQRLQDALVASGHTEELDENLVALFTDLHPHDRRPKSRGPRPVRKPKTPS